ncbi:MAG: helix-turn-helix domain-containing protein [Clostridia bacterium]|nr:helix-turn-helix domain-containing protein [Clostridia bacterium]
MENFATRLKELRTEKNLSQVQLSKATGLSRSVIGYWESGKKHPTSPAIITLAKYFNVTTDYLLGVTDD